MRTRQPDAEAGWRESRRGEEPSGDAPKDDAKVVAASITELAQDSGVPATLAMVRGVQVTQMRSGAAHCWRWRVWRSTAGTITKPSQYAQRALNAGAERAPAELVLARAYAGLGEADQAVARPMPPRRAPHPKEQSFAAQLIFWSCWAGNARRASSWSICAIRAYGADSGAGRTTPGIDGIRPR